MRFANYRSVLFDLDGTLMDTAPDFITALNRMLSERNRRMLPPEVIRAGVTNGSAGLVTLAFGVQPGDRGFDTLREEFLEYYFDSLSEATCLFPALDRLLAELAENDIPWGIVTNKPYRFTEAILNRLEWASPPGAVICPDHVRHTKPDPEGIVLACRQMGADTARTLYVGDHLRDIQAGRNAGTGTVSAAYGYIDPGEDPSSWGADYLIHSAGELHGIVFSNQT